MSLSILPIMALLLILVAHVNGFVWAGIMRSPVLPEKFARTEILSTITYLYVTPWVINFHLLAGHRRCNVCGEMHKKRC